MSSDIKNNIQKIINFYNLGEYNRVIELSNIFIKKNPESDFVLNILGLSYQKRNEFGKAEKVLMLAFEINQNNTSVINNIANNFKYKFDFENAEKFYELALKKNSKNTNTLLNYGNFKFTLNKNDEALNLLIKAHETNDKLIPIHLNLAIVYQSLGNFNKAIEHLNKIIDIDPKFTRADKMLSSLLDYKKEVHHKKEMLKKIDRDDLSVQQKIYLHFALGKAFEDVKQYKDAFNFIKTGNKLKREVLNFNIENDKKLFEQIKKIFENYDHQEEKNSINDLKPIFILGMPRSGTTLIEQIISSHKDVKGFGELNFLNKICEHEFVTKNLFQNHKFTEENKQFIYNSYKNILKNFSFENKKFTDKTLLNFFWIGVIKTCFPDAIIINCIRNAKDNCISIYKNLFDYEGGWCYDEKELTQYYKIYQDTIKYWKTKFPNFIQDIKYEDIINNSDETIRKLINLCNLEWDDNCLNFYENQTAIKTLSVNQARKKIYSNSINSFDNYKDFAKDLFKDL